MCRLGFGVDHMIFLLTISVCYRSKFGILAVKERNCLFLILITLFLIIVPQRRTPWSLCGLVGSFNGWFPPPVSCLMLPLIGLLYGFYNISMARQCRAAYLLMHGSCLQISMSFLLQLMRSMIL